MNTTITALTAITEHLIGYALAEPASVTAGRSADVHHVQLGPHTLPELAAELLAWADTTTLHGLHAWRPAGHHDQVHLRATTELPGGITVTVYGAVFYSSAHFPDLQPKGTQPIGMSVLRAWADDATPAGGAAA